MRAETRNELLLLGGLAVALPAAIAIAPSGGVATILSLSFLLVLPGYALLAALFPRATEMSATRRMALSVGVSVAAVILIGMIINFTGWGIGPGPVSYSVAGLVLGASAAAWMRRRRLPIEERSGVHLRLSFPFEALRNGWRLMDVRGKALSALLAAAVAVALTAAGYIIVVPKAGDAFTGFYLPGPITETAGYPRDARVGDDIEVTVGIHNHEQVSVEYRIETWIGGVLKNEVWPIRIANGERWQGVLSFTPDVAGEHTMVEFRLYRNREADPWLEPLYLWVNVTE